MTIHAWAAMSPRAPLEPFRYTPGELAGDEVEVAVECCGICHSDVHLVDGEWGDVFPVVPGHEIVGTVAAGGAIPIGTRVGIGWQRSSCGECERCRSGEEELCARGEATCMGNFGGFADRIRVNHRFAIPLPEQLDSRSAAPLLCGGITVYSPLRRYAASGGRVAVIGIGGLGHLGLQFARALGCEIWAFSRRKDKEETARALGAHHFVVGIPPRDVFDLVLNTAHAVCEMDTWLSALRAKGVFCQLGATAEPIAVPSIHLIVGHKSVSGSAVGAPGMIREMLALAVEHGIAAKVETAPMRHANDALERTRRNAARYRMVLTR